MSQAFAQKLSLGHPLVSTQKVKPHRLQILRMVPEISADKKWPSSIITWIVWFLYSTIHDYNKMYISYHGVGSQLEDKAYG